MNVNALAKETLNDAALDAVSGGFSGARPSIPDPFGRNAWYCSCGQKNIEDEKRCIRCGKEPWELLHCENCGCSADAYAYHNSPCPNCGNLLR